MSVKTMADYLAAKTADYDFTLTLAPQQIMPESGFKKQEVHEYDDGSVAVVTLATQSYFEIQIQWAALSYTDAGTILDLWHDVNKANGKARTFRFQHPRETTIYVVRFFSDLSRIDRVALNNFKSIPAVTLRVEGKVA